jgi:hypothetical protein
MKVTREIVEPKFVPVTLALESQAEVDAISALIGHVRQSDCGVDFSHAYDALNPHVVTHLRFNISKY